MNYSFKNQTISRIAILTFIVFLTTFQYSYSQLTTNSSVTKEQLVDKIVGTGVTVKNIKYTGDASARGTFNGASSNIGIKDGIILATGYAYNATGPNDDPVNGSPYWIDILKSHDFGRVGEVDLAALQGCTDCIHDAAVLEFDFVPGSSSLTFKYVFASEEYPFYVCSKFNDVFGFFVSGPKPGGGNYVKQNIAFIPGTSIPVAINSVNSGTPGFDPNCPCYWPSSDCSSLSYSNFFINNGDGSTPNLNKTVQYNGFTTPFSATIDVIPCQTYHIKLAVADVADGKYDSGIFLEANSFTSNTMTATTKYTNAKIDSVAVKGCNDAVVTFKLPKAPQNDTTITYTIGGTAQNGGDYETLSGSVVILAGQTTGSFTLKPFLNGTTSGNLTFTFGVALTSCSDKVTYTIKIKENPAIVVTPGADQNICTGKSANISANATGGVGALTYLWSNSAGNTSNVNVSPAATTTYTISVTDVCNSTKTANVKVNVFPLPDFSVTPSGQLSFCSGDSVKVEVVDNGQELEYQWLMNNSEIAKATNKSYYVKAAGSYVVKVTNSNSCSKTSEVIVAITSQIQAGVEAQGNTNICKGSQVVLNSTNNGSNLSYKWLKDGSLIPDATSINYSANEDGEFSVIVSSSATCLDTSKTIQVKVLPLPKDSIKTLGGNLCTGKSVTLTFIGEADNLTYQWQSNGADIEGETNSTYLASKKESYTLKVTDKNNCTNISNKVEVEKASFYMISDLISPEGANECNKSMRIEGMCIGKVNVLIYDRWGRKVYEHDWDFATSNENIKCKGSGNCQECTYYGIWDGKNKNGNIVPSGVYFYVLKVYDSDGNSISPKEGKLNGTVTLMK